MRRTFPFTPLAFFALVFQQLALYVLSFLEPKDLLQAAQTCRYWRILAEDNLLWREKCREEGESSAAACNRRFDVVTPVFRTGAGGGWAGVAG